MAGTATATLVSNARVTLLETTANFWTDAELTDLAYKAYKDLWKAIIDLDQGHFRVIDETNVSWSANTNVLSGVPADCFRVELIELVDQTSANAIQDLTFEPCKDYYADFTAARGLGAQSPSGQTIYYSLIGAGAPQAAPTIEVAPQINTVLAAGTMRLVYTQILGATPANNPIPGESDHAVEAWIIAFARAKERADRSADPFWLNIYATEKTGLLKVLTPREDQEPEYVEALYEPWWNV